MRLTEREKSTIKKLTEQYFGPDATILLFGSRTDSKAKGGDIDLYLIPGKNNEKLHEKKIKFLVALELEVGEQKIDLVIENKEQPRSIDQVAKKEGIQL